MGDAGGKGDAFAENEGGGLIEGIAMGASGEEASFGIVECTEAERGFGGKRRLGGAYVLQPRPRDGDGLGRGGARCGVGAFDSEDGGADG